MKSLSPSLKINTLRSLAGKLKKESNPFKESSAKIQREIDPDYTSKKKSILSGKLFNK